MKRSINNKISAKNILSQVSKNNKAVSKIKIQFTKKRIQHIKDVDKLIQTLKKDRRSYQIIRRTKKGRKIPGSFNSNLIHLRNSLIDSFDDMAPNMPSCTCEECVTGMRDGCMCKGCSVSAGGIICTVWCPKLAPQSNSSSRRK
jgi:hypothetical protein